MLPMCFVAGRTLLLKVHLVLPSAVALLLACSVLAADEPSPSIRLSGLICFGTNAVAIIEDQSAKPEQVSVLSEGEAERRISLIKIDRARQSVEIHSGASFTDLGFATNQASTTSASPAVTPNLIRLQQAPLHPVLDIYQRLVGRTCVRSPLLPAVRLDLDVKNAAAETDLAKAIEQALAAKGLRMRPDRDKFTVVATESDFLKVTPQLWEVAGAIEASLNRPGNEQIPPGFLDFRGADLFQFENIYQDLCSRTLLRPSATALQPLVWLRTATPLSRREAVYLFNTVLALSNVSVRDVGDKFLLVFPTVQTNIASAVLARKLPEHQLADQTPLPSGAIELWAVGLPELKDLYQRLVGKPVTGGAGSPDIHFLLRNKNPLTPAEALKALDLLLAWHGLAIVPDTDGKSLKLVRADTGS